MEGLPHATVQVDKVGAYLDPRGKLTNEEVGTGPEESNVVVLHESKVLVEVVVLVEHRSCRRIHPPN